MSDMSFVIRYLRSVPPHTCTIRCEKYCETQAAALTFCVVLRNRGGEAIELVQLIQGREDAVLDGRDLDAAIDRQRMRIEENAVPPWR
ncbi:MAG: hypothetical protein JWM91_5108 [Rhodospirillales bacterium]|nr:hypothetical protein [Rhodospirillales bacterium]